MLRARFGTQNIKIDAFDNEFVVICEHCNKPLPISWIPYGHEAFCSIDCIENWKRYNDICSEFNRCSRI